MDERKFIAWIAKQSRPSPDVPVGIGDDTAVIRRRPGKKDLLLKADMIVEKVHFNPRTSKPAQWGYKYICFIRR